MKATKHRVVDIGVIRYSSAFFAEPKYSAVIPTNMLVPDEEQTEPAIKFGPWFIRRLVNKYVEWKGFDLSQIED